MCDSQNRLANMIIKLDYRDIVKTVAGLQHTMII
jgi:hypothetical protein